ncbi:MAG TPA: hypothetical protein VF157_09325 [Chloroflexota bacterium]
MSDGERGPAGEVLPLARKLVGLATEQHRALEFGTKEQFDWITLRRDEVTQRLSRLLAAHVQVSPEESAALQQLRTDLLAVDDAIQTRLKRQRAEADKRRRGFSRTRKAVGSYVSLGPRQSSFLDKQS